MTDPDALLAARVFHALTDHGVTAPEIAHRAGLNATQTYAGLERLLKRRCIRVVEDPDRHGLTLYVHPELGTHVSFDP